MALSAEIRTAIERNVWSSIDLKTVGRVTTMLSDSELKMLHWLARELPVGADACIVDAGCFLGGSTAALASGLSLKPGSAIIHSYDIFLAPNDRYSQGLIGGRPPGTSVFDLYEANIRPFRDMIVPHIGDFTTAPLPQEKIGILFVDVAKSWELNERVIRGYFPKLIPGRSIVVQQDHNDHSCPWVNITMEHYSRYFEFLSDDSGSRLFLCTGQVAPDANPLRESLSMHAMLDLLRAAAGRSRHPIPAYMTLITGAWIVFEFDGVEAASAYLEGLPPQPWSSAEPYINGVRDGMNHLGDASGLRRYSDQYFSG
jgi:hypothetical protein